jgi:hypothetical protein
VSYQITTSARPARHGDNRVGLYLFVWHLTINQCVKRSWRICIENTSRDHAALPHSIQCSRQCRTVCCFCRVQKCDVSKFAAL